MPNCWKFVKSGLTARFVCVSVHLSLSDWACQHGFRCLIWVNQAEISQPFRLRPKMFLSLRPRVLVWKIFSCYILATSFLATLRGRGSFYGNKFVDTIFYRITIIIPLLLWSYYPNAIMGIYQIVIMVLLSNDYYVHAIQLLLWGDLVSFSLFKYIHVYYNLWLILYECKK